MLLLLVACAPLSDDSAALDLAARLAEGEVRAGVVTDPAALFGGVSAEGRVGDVKLYNDRVQFVIQQPGDSSFYVEYGGGIVDADVVRAAGEPGRDVVDELVVMVGLGRLMDAERVEVVSDGTDGAAVVRVEGPAAPMHLVTGALESAEIVPDLDLWIRTEYRLEPGAWVLTLTTTVQNREAADVEAAVGDVGLVAMDVAEPYVPGRGLEGADLRAVEWSAAVGQRNEVALAILGEDGPLEQGTIGQILGEIAPTIAGFGPTVVIPAGGETTYTRRVGVAPDPATLTGAQLAWRGVERQLLGGVVRDGQGAAVAGARVHVLDGRGDPLTLAFADGSGAWSAVVPAGPVSAVATGRGHALTVDLPAGHGWYSPYEADPTGTLASLRSGATPIPFAEGCGVGAASAPGELVLPGCGTVRVTVADGGPAVVHLYPLEGQPSVDERLVPGRPDGASAVGFVRDGALDVPVDPGTYAVYVRRGVREELWTGSVTVAAGGTSTVEAAILPSWSVPGVVVGDPHSHASPSGDGGIPMEDRLLVTAANGIDVHFGTDHDHVADYTPLLAPLGLEGRLRTVIADEVSTVLRGHFNAWPATPSDGPNHGAPQWWFGYEDTAEIFGWMRALVGPTGVIQANHPVGSSGMFSFADYDIETGRIGAPDRWSGDFQAMEVLNSGEWEPFFPYYLDLVRRGHKVTPVGVSDSHGHTSGEVGLSLTFFLVDDEPGLPSDVELTRAVAEGATAVGRGAFVDVRIGGSPAPGRVVYGGRVVPRIVVRAPSWVPVDRVVVWVDGEPVQTLACTGTAPEWCDVAPVLDLSADASVVVTAEGVDRGVGGAFAGRLAWGMAAAFFVDANADGVWEAPYAGLNLGG